MNLKEHIKSALVVLVCAPIVLLFISTQFIYKCIKEVFRGNRKR